MACLKVPSQNLHDGTKENLKISVRIASDSAEI
jgi:hypothetical protein